MITETKSITFEEEKTYQQDWPAYKLAQSIEKKRFQELLVDLCRNIQEPERSKRGRKPHLVKDAIFAMVYKAIRPSVRVGSLATLCKQLVDFSLQCWLGYWLSLQTSVRGMSSPCDHHD